MEPWKVELKIRNLRGIRVLLDRDLAVLYGVSVKRLNEQVRRNKKRFPVDFMFQVTKAELVNLRSQIATSSLEWGGRRYRPLAFTEQGVSMLSGVLNSPRAIQANIQIMRVFVRLRRYTLTYESLARKIGLLESKYDQRFLVVFDSLRKLMTPPEPKRRRIGFTSHQD